MKKEAVGSSGDVSVRLEEEEALCPACEEGVLLVFSVPDGALQVKLKGVSTENVLDALQNLVNSYELLPKEDPCD
ncbi:MAG: hypothetical protein JSW58_08670 [Candidatus Latescibacterota bacterium]|nr:MAG: hypothetical protein JSW58_08670 [Candidatus Latescibacterota bacterium]